MAAVLDSDRVGLLPAGIVVAPELDMAAEQVCAHLPVPEAQAGACYLVATPAVIEPDTATGRLVTDSRYTWVNRVSREGADWTLSEWVPAEGRLRLLDPARWRGGQPDAPGRR
ncbi:hypothetical protein [Nocardia sp. NPDC051570]|uniref:hypothetical protein n=1 Tax=Nocardia sp. NPDC051570 TaxID=3364324 RepID=UPI00379FC220